MIHLNNPLIDTRSTSTDSVEHEVTAATKHTEARTQASFTKAFYGTHT